MRLHLYVYKCAKFGHVFKAPELPDDPYGTFLMRSEKGETALLRATQSPEYQEVDQLLSTTLQANGTDRFRRAELLQAIFGVACDPAPDGTLFQINRNPPCPRCGTTAMESWEPTDPPELVDELVAEVSHHRWHKMSGSEKSQAVREATMVI